MERLRLIQDESDCECEGCVCRNDIEIIDSGGGREASTRKHDLDPFSKVRLEPGPFDAQSRSPRQDNKRRCN